MSYVFSSEFKRHWMLFAVISVSFCGLLRPAAAGTLSENFDNVASLSSRGWTIANNSSPAGTTDWFQGNSGLFAAFNGAPDSYAAANFLATDSAGGQISDWLITPYFVFGPTTSISFYTRTETGSSIPDSLELRYSTSGDSVNTGNSSVSTGDFSSTLLSLNPGFIIGGYPDGWTQYTAQVTGLAAGSEGRFAFRYVVDDTTVHGDYIGIDDVLIDGVAPAPEPGTLGILAISLAVLFGLACRRFALRR